MARNLYFRIYKPKENKLTKILKVIDLSREYFLHYRNRDRSRWILLPMAAQVGKVKIFEGDIILFVDLSKSEAYQNKTEYKVIWRNDGYIAESDEGDDWGPFTKRITPVTGYDMKNIAIKIVGNIHLKTKK